MTIQELHDHLYELLCVIDSICQKENVKYFLGGGTELGSVREKNFIQWDDDADIGVRVEDYNSFKRAMMDNLPSYMQFIEPQELSPFFYDFVIRIVDKRYLLRSNTDENRAYKNYQNYVGVDVFICCGCPAGKIRQSIFIFTNKMLYGMGMAFRYSIDLKKYSLIELFEIKLSCLLGRLYSGKTPDRTIKAWFRLINRIQASKSGWRLCANTSPQKFYMKPMPETWFEGTDYGVLRGKSFPIISGHHEKLQLIYGDYMTPERNPEKYITHIDADI